MAISIDHLDFQEAVSQYEAENVIVYDRVASNYLFKKNVRVLRNERCD